MLRIHRLAHWFWCHRVPLVPLLLKLFNRVVFAVSLPPSVKVGRGVVFSYSGLGTVVHKRAVIADGAVIGTGVTIGGRSGHHAVPHIGAGAMIGSGAKILGPVHVGAGASIGANAVVISDVPAYAVAVGVPARVIRVMAPQDRLDYALFSGEPTASDR
jgi:serine O-acetyltransferase